MLTLSVILAVRNEGKYIRESLTDLLSQDADYSCIEILIADGKSDDDTLPIILKIIGDYSNREIRVFINHLQLQYCGVNRLICNSRGRYLLIVDGHSRYPNNFFEQNLLAIRESGADIVGGILLSNESSGRFSKAIQACLSTWFGVGNSKFRTYGRSGDSDVAAFPCVCRDVFERIGLFREEQKSNADLEFFGRARRAGLKIEMDSRIQSEYFPRSTLKDLAQQMHRNAKWLPTQLNAIRVRHIVPFVFVMCIVFLPIIALIVAFFWWLYLIMIISYLGLGVYSVTTYRRRELKPIHRLEMVLCYFIMHFSYGIGWIHGFFSEEIRSMRRFEKLSPPVQLSVELVAQLVRIET